MEADTAPPQERVRVRLGTEPSGAERLSDSALPLVALARDAHELRINEFAARHGAHFLVRGGACEDDGFLRIANDYSVSHPTDLFDAWVYRIDTETGSVRVGSGTECDVCISDSTLAEEHATLDFSRETPTVTDHGSNYGTWIGFDLIAPLHPTPVRVDRALCFGLVSTILVPAPTLVKILRKVFARA